MRKTNAKENIAPEALHGEQLRPSLPLSICLQTLHKHYKKSPKKRGINEKYSTYITIENRFARKFDV